MKLFRGNSWFSFLVYLLLMFIIFFGLINLIFFLFTEILDVEQIPVQPENGNKNGTRGEVKLSPGAYVLLSRMVKVG